jgi:hypothetical protein
MKLSERISIYARRRLGKNDSEHGISGCELRRSFLKICMKRYLKKALGARTP